MEIEPRLLYPPITGTFSISGMAKERPREVLSRRENDQDMPVCEGCTCKGHCTLVSGLETECICDISYDENRLLLEHFLLVSAPPITECGLKCSCLKTCPNRTSQNPPMDALRVLQTERKGLGVFTEVDVSKGAFIGQYVGEILTNSEASKRLSVLGEDGVCYLVEYREHTSSGVVVHTNIDATYKGNITRFINHSCSPNSVMLPVRSMGGVLPPRLCVFACRDIRAGEEVAFSYFGQGRPEVSAASQRHRLGKKSCHCGAKDCVGYLPLEH